MIKMLDVVRIKNLSRPEDEYNGAMAITVTDIYNHPKAGVEVIQIKIGNTLYSIETKNLDVVSNSERDDYMRGLDGNQKTSWDECLFKPKLISGEPK